MPGTMEFEFGFSQPQTHSAKLADDAMHILVLGDFSGRTGQTATANDGRLGQRQPIAVDIDNFDTVLARCAPRLKLPLAGAEETVVTLDFKQLDDFHPDTLYRQLDLFQTLRKTRARLADPATFTQAAAELLPSASAPTDLNSPSNSTENEAQLLDRLLGQPSTAASPAQPATGGHPAIDQLIKSLVQPHIVPGADNRQPELVAGVDAAISEQLRKLLHHPDFQRLEALWRSVHNLVTELVADEELKVFLLDVTQQELLADVRASATDLRQSGLYQLLVEQPKTLGGQPWSLLIGDYYFAAEAEDIALLAALGALGAQAGAPFIAGAKAELLGCHSATELSDPANWQTVGLDTAQHWQALRGSWIAAWLGLALPRVLLRLPYAQRSDPIESFDFEELPAASEHEAYLWGNPAFFCAQLLATAFLENGWTMQPDDCLEVGDLPAYTYSVDGESQMQPCAETLLGERATQAILQRGIMPLLSYRNGNTVRLARFQSLADPAASLAGPWQ